MLYRSTTLSLAAPIVVLALGCSQTPASTTADGQGSTDAASTTRDAPSSETSEELDEGVRRSFDDTDADADARVSRQEFEADGIPVVLATWDDDDDGNLAGDEMYVIHFDAVDANQDRFISASELDRSRKSARAADPGIDASDAAAFANADGNGDGRLSPAEARVLADELGLIAAWDDDGNGELDRTEITSFVYATYDEDGDGYLTFAEWVAH